MSGRRKSIDHFLLTALGVTPAHSYDAAMSEAVPPSDASDAADHKRRMQALNEEQKKKVQSKNEQRGILIVNTGDGKGKSTAAFGLALRAAGSQLRVGLVQFIKGNWKTGEKEALKRFPEIDHVVSGKGFTWVTQDKQKDIAAARAGWEAALEMIRASDSSEPKYHVVILDELNVALSHQQLPLDEVVEALRNKPKMLNVVVTGRGAAQELIDIADTVTEMTPVKHAFDAGIQAQRGIEF